MNEQIIKSGLILAAVLLTSPKSQAQGTTYISSLGETSSGNSSVGSDSWLAVDFRTGNNIGGYTLNSVELAMTVSSGNPSGFTVMVYTAVVNSAAYPAASLGNLSGSLNPVTAGVYTYNSASGITFAPNTYYFIVLAAGSAVATGAYTWGVTGTYPPTLGGGWTGDLLAHSSDGVNWNYISGSYPQFDINATPVPEPGVSTLLILGSLGFLLHRREIRLLE